MNMLTFLSELKENNSIDWMHAHRAQYLEAKTEFEQLVQEMIEKLSHEDSSIAHLQAKDLLFKLNRDTRFSHDKSPYNPAFRAHIAPDGRMPIPVGYYISISPQQSFLGGGLFAHQFKDATAKIRQHILDNGSELEAILKAPDFAENFTLDGEKLKKVPKDYPVDVPQAEYLKHKSWFVEYFISDEYVCANEFCDNAVNLFLKMRPFNNFLNQGLKGFEFPARP